MQRDLPGEAHAAVHLDGGPGVGEAASSASSLAPDTRALEQLPGVQPAAAASAAATSGASARQAAACTAARATSARTSMSAQMCLTAWKVPIGLPNWWRSLA